MSSIDLAILGIVLEKPQSAYDIQKDIEYHNFSRWTKISIPSVYKKVLQLKEKGYLTSDVVKGERFAEKAEYYSITEAGRAYFEALMDTIAEQNVPLTFDFNVVVTNLTKLDQAPCPSPGPQAAEKHSCICGKKRGVCTAICRYSPGRPDDL